MKSDIFFTCHLFAFIFFSPCCLLLLFCVSIYIFLNFFLFYILICSINFIGTTYFCFFFFLLIFLSQKYKNNIVLYFQPCIFIVVEKKPTKLNRVTIIYKLFSSFLQYSVDLVLFVYIR